MRESKAQKAEANAVQRAKYGAYKYGRIMDDLGLKRGGVEQTAIRDKLIAEIKAKIAAKKAKP